MQYRVSLITKYLALRGWTQADLARAINKDPGTVSRIIRGLHDKAPTMKLIADVLNIPMEEFIQDDNAA